MAAKAAVNQLTVSLALTHARDGIRVNAILPGLIDTPLARQQLDGEAARRHEAAHINGVCLPVDDGPSARA